MQTEIIIRPYQLNDARALVDIYYYTIQGFCGGTDKSGRFLIYP
jgi:hypothetical protein